ncbi:MAG: MBL fold metallo-hydrolase [Ignavibacteria bacterium GWA2_55_11]|nr:MAG: MBL fold metallo-hydrolase [Ignavibacteria bacterium GWA2_55_11]OGU44774.1 MAG: MBL fold metallo-hydrolase [Ignavibacteria bacterium GWC2_56_12]OGU63787.1 MAG: MBL fold metallo-hydrolase [Ignavibacteria bacterium RIFCSPHIGHO2_02_FULL_56_12]OGU70918.1 MAG: MBL fold metallo-hydrolase [Ignavibacteria bacterium RIFCSPLOWO2_12_FULL_56_21]OGU74336.1 MAG: MBL fold metallo-hydrolase [Ignavibacteria bacterium RIFCSPLOWO2_02_FULL_55_14]HAV23577.1 MBL fold metallo-hydrolase [Bacteroidota bacteriu
MRLQFHGAARTVTGSMHRLMTDDSTVLLEGGLFQGRRQESYERNKNFPFDPSSVHALLLSHAHADHAGNLPNLVRSGFAGRIYSTPATRDLCNITLYDSAYIQVRDAEVVNRIHRKHTLPAVEPLYGPDDVRSTMDQFVTVPYHKSFQAADGVDVSFADAGHILGSASMMIDVKEKGRSLRVGFTGDLGRKNMPILRDPEPLGDVDVLVCESTYGGHQHEDQAGMRERLATVVRSTAERGGKVIVPAFSLGRTQEFVYILFELFDQGLLAPLPVYVDSPLAVNASDVFRMHPECFDQNMISYLHQNEDPFGFSRLHYVRSVEESKRLNRLSGSCVIVSASGMCEAGRIVHHLANNIEDPRSTILIISYQAEHTLGRRLVNGDTQVKILGELRTRRAEVVKLNAFSAHAGQDELLACVRAMDRKRLKRIFLVHGELEQAEVLAARLKEEGYGQAVIPERGDIAELA